jgi:transcriptional regulator with XRE-family HTH domain
VPRPIEASRAIGALIRERRERHAISGELIAEKMSEHGFDWHQPTVSRTERGERPLTIEEMIAIADVLTSLGARTTPKELLDAGGRAMPLATAEANVERWARANPKSQVPSLVGPAAERRMALALTDRLGRVVSVEDVRRASRRIFGRTLAEEREARLSEGSQEGSAAVRRGHVSRQLLVELLRELNRRRR